jgi:4-deoxy-L-threo-5-hexosulose-uronate ketol-isomerase
MNINYEVRYSNHPSDAKHYDTERIRKEFLADGIMKANEINE